VLTFTVWDTSWLLSGDSVLGRLLHTLIGYIDRRSGAQLLVYLLTVTLIVGSTRLKRPLVPAMMQSSPDPIPVFPAD
jgi:high-affinity iron transporter